MVAGVVEEGAHHREEIGDGACLGLQLSRHTEAWEGERIHSPDAAIEFSGASGFMSYISMWPGPPSSQIMMTDVLRLLPDCSRAFAYLRQAEPGKPAAGSLRKPRTTAPVAVNLPAEPRSRLNIANRGGYVSPIGRNNRQASQRVRAGWSIVYHVDARREMENRRNSYRRFRLFHVCLNNPEPRRARDTRTLAIGWRFRARYFSTFAVLRVSDGREGTLFTCVRRAAGSSGSAVDRLFRSAFSCRGNEPGP